ncbi:hypothetical protein FOA52_012745 [Chlamydomonas sp. UWO 241]|nr:hypothetical protein FOA52_012745 [Chlamydomonas sp. UWO 241]
MFELKPALPPCFRAEAIQAQHLFFGGMHGQLLRAVAYPQCDDVNKPDINSTAWDMLLKVNYTMEHTAIVVGCRPLEADGPYRDALRRVLNADTDDLTLVALVQGTPLDPTTPL